MDLLNMIDPNRGVEHGTGGEQQQRQQQQVGAGAPEQQGIPVPVEPTRAEVTDGHQVQQVEFGATGVEAGTLSAQNLRAPQQDTADRGVIYQRYDPYAYLPRVEPTLYHHQPPGTSTQVAYSTGAPPTRTRQVDSDPMALALSAELARKLHSPSKGANNNEQVWSFVGCESNVLVYLFMSTRNGCKKV
jgi:hypothetical protein